MTRARTTRRRVYGAAAVLLALAALFLAVSLRLFAWPPTHLPERADAIVVLAGVDVRLEFGEEIAERGLAPLLLVSNPPGVDRNICEESRNYEIRCFDLEEISTRGEAQALRPLSDELDVNHLVVVTSTWHVTRARMRIAQCVDGPVDAVGVGSLTDQRPRHMIPTLVREWGGVLHAAIVDREC